MHKRQFFLITAIMFPALYNVCLSQDMCGAASIDSAEFRYEIGRFDECIQGLNNCLNTKTGFNAEQKVQAYYLMAKSYLAEDMPENADSAIEALLLLKENFETDFRDPVRFRDAVTAMRSNIISSVSKQNEDIRLAPATTAVITKEEIQQRGYNDLIDLLKDVPGFDISIYYGQLYANVYQRGLRTNNTEKTLLLFDGVEENDLWSNFADISQQYPITNIKRVEIIYGPASTMYGPNAFAGVINIITKEPVDFLSGGKSFGIIANTGIGSYNSRYLGISIAYKKGVFSFSVTGRFYQSDRPNLSSSSLWNFNPAAYNDTIPNYRYKKILSLESNAKKYLRDNGMPYASPFYQVANDQLILTDAGEAEAIRLNKTLYNQDKNKFTEFSNPSKSYYVNAKINIDDLSLGFVSWQKNEGIGTTFTDYIASVSGSRWITAHNYLYMKYNKRINEKLLLTVFLNYRIHTIKDGSKITTKQDYSRLGGLEIKDLQKGVPASWLTTYYYEQSEQFRSEFKLLYSQSKYFNLLSGVELRNSQLQGYYLTDTTSSVPQNNGTYPVTTGGNLYNVNDLGIYTQGNYRARIGLGFTAGARLDYNEIRQGGGLGYHLSPRIVIDYAKREWVFKTIFSKGIQNVSNYTKFDEVIVTPNPSLTSESIYNYEFSVRNKISGSLTADIDFYYSKVKNVVETILANYFLQNENVGEFEIKGIMANLYYKSPNKKWQVSFNYSYTNPKQTRDFDSLLNKIINVDNIIGDIAFHKINANANIILLKNFNINFRANYTSSKKTGLGTTVPQNKSAIFNGYFLGNVTLGAINIVKGAILQFVCNNIFNKEYNSPGIRSAGGIRFPNTISQMGRNFFLKVYFEF